MLSVSLVSTKRLAQSFVWDEAIRQPRASGLAAKITPAGNRHAGDHFRAKQFAQTTHLLDRAPGDKQPGLAFLRF
jgi:hypothetical protein